MLLIRLDLIGDYLLFRNSLSAYKQSAKWRAYEITLLGNEKWKEVFELLDTNSIDKTIWVNTNRYMGDDECKRLIWEKLRQQHFDTVISTSRIVRDSNKLLLDDLCAFATHAPLKIGTENNFDSHELNTLSNSVYTQIFSPKEKHQHEFFFNREFANWCTDVELPSLRPEIKMTPKKNEYGSYILCCIGSTQKSKQWPVEKWVSFIQICQRKTAHKIILIGGANEKSFADNIQSKTNAINMTGQVSLPEMIHYVKNSTAVIACDSMAAHLGVSCNVPTIIVANGNNFPRFTAYEEAGIKNVKTVYTAPFLRIRKNGNYEAITEFEAVTNDMTTIKADAVVEAMNELLQANHNFSLP